MWFPHFFKGNLNSFEAWIEEMIKLKKQGKNAIFLF